MAEETEEVIFMSLSELDLQLLQREILGVSFMAAFNELTSAFTSKRWNDCHIKSKVLLDITWEKLNTGYWKDVHHSWRYAYTFLSLFKSLSEFQLFQDSCDKEMLKESIHTCDMGLLMGIPVHDNILSKLVCMLQKQFSRLISEKGVLEPRAKQRKQIPTCITYPSIKQKHLLSKLDLPSLEGFKKMYVEKGQPVIITNAINHWPAFNDHKWTLDYINDVAGCRTVPIEIGSKYTDDAWSQRLMTVSEFIQKHIESPEGTTGYLAQHELFEQIPELQNDISVPTYCCLGQKEGVDINAWFGPKETVSPLHHDPKHNFLCQVVGEKYIKLYSQDDTGYLYPNESKLLFNTSQVDVENPNLVDYPDFVKASSLECILKPGEMLYIPPKYWHYVRSLSTSFSVSFWWE